MASDIDEELMLPYPSMSVNVPMEEPTIYPSPDFTVPICYTTVLMQPPIESTHLPHIAAPPGLDSDLMGTAARYVAQVK